MPKPTLHLPQTASDIYQRVITKVRKQITLQMRYVLDPETGIQKQFLDGKLIALKQVREPNSYKPAKVQ